MTSLCFPTYQDPKGADSFLLEKNPFSEGKQNNFDRVIPLESVFIPLKGFLHLNIFIHFTFLKS